MSQRPPRKIELRQRERVLAIDFESDETFCLNFEYLRVYSPSAEVRGHGTGTGVLQVAKENVNITAVDPVGNYAVKLVFDDGHNSGIYSWNYLRELCLNQKKNWRDYLHRLEAAGHVRKVARDG